MLIWIGVVKLNTVKCSEASLSTRKVSGGEKYCFNFLNWWNISILKIIDCYSFSFEIFWSKLLNRWLLSTQNETVVVTEHHNVLIKSKPFHTSLITFFGKSSWIVGIRDALSGFLKSVWVLSWRILMERKKRGLDQVESLFMGGKYHEWLSFWMGGLS